MSSNEARGTSAPYTIAWAVLVALWATSYLLSHARLGAWGTPIAFGIGALKALLIGLVFMHLSRARASHVIAAVTALALIATLIAVVVIDVVMRSTPRLLTP